MEDFSAISTFVRVVEAKSFAAAASQLGMTPSGVSRAVSRLESQLGARLLFRSTRSLRLTDDGASFHARCKEILADLAEATEALNFANSKPTGKLRVGISLSVGRAAVIPRLTEFEQRYPDIRLELSMSDSPADLNGEGLDCAIRVGELEDSSLIARKIGYLSNVVCASPEYLRKYGAPRSIEDLKSHRCINYVYPNGRPRQWQFDTPGGQMSVDIDAHMLINDGESVLQAVAAGLGITQVPRMLAACLLEKGMLERVMTDTHSTGKPVWIVYPQKKHLSARVQAFIEWVRELFDRTNQPGQCAVDAPKTPPKPAPRKALVEAA
ncbi:LysR family transcriptional regulator [Rhodanobacter denitrificans]|uniref:Transcriptional regulator n=1 Tax=Rhodanobacter denitrificans TaxID=666685 RepID=M4NA50_9GAMM|nr:LysR family transcriptional regulator [Rhodanobacter denitrificans]AGG87259.1 transcriptional regulator [Rhodanobacter denitrificans]UJM86446.1 LysR family transcriptional regulator [Rhodanobacter denitrificans]